MAKTKAELEAENKELRQRIWDFANPEKAELVSFTEGIPSFRHPLVPIFFESLAQMLTITGATNYVETEAYSKNEGHMILTVQRWKGKTPHQLRQEAEAEVSRIQDILAEALRLNEGMLHPDICDADETADSFEPKCSCAVGKQWRLLSAALTAPTP